MATPDEPSGTSRAQITRVKPLALSSSRSSLDRDSMYSCISSASFVSLVDSEVLDTLDLNNLAKSDYLTSGQQEKVQERPPSGVQRVSIIAALKMKVSNQDIIMCIKPMCHEYHSESTACPWRDESLCPGGLKEKIKGGVR